VSERAPADWDPRRPDVVADPYPILRRLQDEDPVHWSPILGGWVVTRYADVRDSLADARLSSDRIGQFLSSRGPVPDPATVALWRGLRRWAVFTDPPLHTRLRGALAPHFAGRELGRRLRPRIEALVSGLLDRAAGRGEMDVVGDLAGPLPVVVIAELLGVPESDRARLKPWSDELAAFVGSAIGTADRHQRAARSLGEMSEYLAWLAAERRRAPRDDVTSALVAASARGELSEEELVASGVMLLFAGHETTTNLIGNATLALLRHPAEAAAWRAEPALASSAVEELLRWDGPGQAMVRVAAEDVELGGRTIRRGERLFLMVNAANRDPRQFADPDRLDLRRADNRHLAFGHGAHFCLGAPLARMEAQVALGALLRRFPGLALRDAPLAWLPSVVFRGLRALPVALGTA
jgi:hypothetical protein